MYGAPPFPTPHNPVLITHSVEGPQRPKVDKVVRSLQPAFVKCYERALKKHPVRPTRRVAGTLLDLKVDSSGKISVDVPRRPPSSSAQALLDIPDHPEYREFAQALSEAHPCLVARVKKVRFPADGPSDVQLYLTFASPKKNLP